MKRVITYLKITKNVAYYNVSMRWYVMEDDNSSTKYHHKEEVVSNWTEVRNLLKGILELSE